MHAVTRVRLIHHRWRSWERRWRAYIIWTLFVLLALFYYIPVGAVQALVEVQRLQNIPVFKQLLQITFIKSLLQSIFPSESIPNSAA